MSLNIVNTNAELLYKRHHLMPCFSDVAFLGVRYVKSFGRRTHWNSFFFSFSQFGEKLKLFSLCRHSTVMTYWNTRECSHKHISIWCSNDMLFTREDLLHYLLRYVAILRDMLWVGQIVLVGPMYWACLHFLSSEY